MPGLNFKKIARWVLGGACVMILFLLAMVCLDIYLDGVGFSAATVTERLGIIAPMAVLCLLLAVISAVYLSRCRAESKGDESARLYKSPGKSGKKGGTRLGIFIGALLLIGLGVMNGGARDVFVKAINICTECIGIG